MKTCCGLSIDRRILNLDTSWRWMVMFTTRTLRYSHRGGRMDGPRSRSGWCGEERNSMPLPRIYPRFLVSSSWLSRHTDRYPGSLLDAEGIVKFAPNFLAWTSLLPEYLWIFRSRNAICSGFICHCTCFCFNFGVLLFTEYCAFFCGMVVVMLGCRLNRCHSHYSFINVCGMNDRDSILRRGRFFFLRHHVQTGSGVHSAPEQRIHFENTYPSTHVVSLKDKCLDLSGVTVFISVHVWLCCCRHTLAFTCVRVRPTAASHAAPQQ
jgi:hypothetical protein